MFRLDGLSAFAWSGLGALLCCAVWLSVRHIVGVVRKVRTLISQATDESPVEPTEHDDLLAVANAVDLDHFVVWESECFSNKRIQRYAAQLEERAR